MIYCVCVCVHDKHDKQEISAPFWAFGDTMGLVPYYTYSHCLSRCNWCGGVEFMYFANTANHPAVSNYIPYFFYIHLNLNAFKINLPEICIYIMHVYTYTCVYMYLVSTLNNLLMWYQIKIYLTVYAVYAIKHIHAPH